MNPTPDDRQRRAGAIPRRLLPDTATVAADGHLHLGGVDTVELAERYGTPLFVYDEQHLRNRCRAAVDAFPAAPTTPPRRSCAGRWPALAHGEGMRLDVASGGELTPARRAGVPAADLLLHGNNKSSTSCAKRCRKGWAASSSIPSTRSTASPTWCTARASTVLTC
ncbi:MAG: hypothetical protein R2755_33385 [Acidimicrobiales bacterium]